MNAGAAPISNTTPVSLAALPHPGVYLTLTLLQSSPEEPLRIGSVPLPLTSLIQGCQFSWQLLLRPLLLWVLKEFANQLSPNSRLSIPDAPECPCRNGGPSNPPPSWRPLTFYSIRTSCCISISCPDSPVCLPCPDFTFRHQCWLLFKSEFMG